MDQNDRTINGKDGGGNAPFYLPVGREVEIFEAALQQQDACYAERPYRLW